MVDGDSKATVEAKGRLVQEQLPPYPVPLSVKCVAQQPTLRAAHVVVQPEVPRCHFTLSCSRAPKAETGGAVAPRLGYTTARRLARDRCSSPFSTKRRTNSSRPCFPCCTR
jgi:hypothetical protein